MASKTDSSGFTEFETAIAKVLDALQPGDVMSYGDVAAEAGWPGAARAVGSFLRNNGASFPWWRVVNATGRLVPGNETKQAKLLRSEGVTVTNGRARPA